MKRLFDILTRPIARFTLAALLAGPTALSAQVCEINMDWLNDPNSALYQGMGAERVLVLKEVLRDRG